MTTLTHTVLVVLPPLCSTVKMVRVPQPELTMSFNTTLLLEYDTENHTTSFHRVNLLGSNPVLAGAMLEPDPKPLVLRRQAHTTSPQTKKKKNATPAEREG
eukprot:Sspe_Gene.46631::Locus_23341_Transcript_1_1_Confidence_1.000_Length_437::g.46631::m.46631